MPTSARRDTQRLRQTFVGRHDHRPPRINAASAERRTAPPKGPLCEGAGECKRDWRRDKKIVRCNTRWMLRRGESRALPVADKARRTSGSGQNFGGLNAAAKFWAPQQDIAAAIGTKNMPPACFLYVPTPPKRRSRCWKSMIARSRSLRLKSGHRVSQK